LKNVKERHDSLKERMTTDKNIKRPGGAVPKKQGEVDEREKEDL
jgi:hypothetical protein